MAEKIKNKDSGPDTSLANMFSEMQNTGFNSASWLGSSWFEKMSDLGAEWLRFVTERIQEDVKTQHQILHCKNIEDMQRIQAEFFQKAIDQYRAETGKMIELSGAMLTPSEEDERDQASLRHHSTPV